MDADTHDQIAQSCHRDRIWAHHGVVAQLMRSWVSSVSPCALLPELTHYITALLLQMQYTRTLHLTCAGSQETIVLPQYNFIHSHYGAFMNEMHALCYPGTLKFYSDAWYRAATGPNNDNSTVAAGHIDAQCDIDDMLDKTAYHNMICISYECSASLELTLYDGTWEYGAYLTSSSDYDEGDDDACVT